MAMGLFLPARWSARLCVLWVWLNYEGFFISIRLDHEPNRDYEGKRSSAYPTHQPLQLDRPPLTYAAPTASESRSGSEHLPEGI